MRGLSINYSIHIQHKDIMGIQDVHYVQEHPRYYNIEWTLQLHVELNTICQMSIGLFLSIRGIHSNACSMQMAKCTVCCSDTNRNRDIQWQSQPIRRIIQTIHLFTSN